VLFDSYDLTYLVVRRTARFVYVSREEARYLEHRASKVDREWWESEVRTHRLDRLDLERDGYSRGYFTEAGLAAARARHSGSVGATPPCLAALGLSWPSTDADIRRAYRARVKTAHPDGGGSSQKFIELRVAYQQALALAQREVA
jgi:hypothetical protein